MPGGGCVECTHIFYLSYGAYLVLSLHGFAMTWELRVTEGDVETILEWSKTSKQQKEIPFMPARVLLQDFT